MTLTPIWWACDFARWAELFSFLLFLNRISLSILFTQWPRNSPTVRKHLRCNFLKTPMM
uniref:Uncharacterized protein n=1 Tax=Parascaris equorum TaxID=6256 RepID=A0A914R2S5_PAREQ